MDLEKKPRSSAPVNTITYTGPKGSKSFKLETAEVGKWYSFTMNILETGGHLWPMQRETYRKRITALFRNCKNTEYVFAPELSPYGKFHVHGKLVFRKIKDIGFFFNNLGWVACNYELDVINDMVIWDTYMYKQRAVQEKMANHYKIPYEIKTTSEEIFFNDEAE